MTGVWNRTIDTPAGYRGEPSGRQALLDKNYIGKVKDNRDVRSMGRLKVWIPEISQDENDENGWVLVSYCSPFAGATSVRTEENINSGNENTYSSTQKSYGWWAVPPDLNVQVICIFVNGDPAKGYWIGCVYDEQMNHMVPGIASSDGTKSNAEYNRKVPGLGRSEKPARPEHTPLNTGLSTQGLTSDTLRGLTSSSAKRKGDYGLARFSRDRLTHFDKPAKVYGFLSPKGHQFVMDDGYTNSSGQEENSYIRFRTSNGTQILIDDTEGFIYLISKNGNTWMELSDKNGIGNIDLFSATNINLHSESGSLNIKAGQDINLHAGNLLSIKAGEIQIESGDYHLTADALYQTASGDINIKSSAGIFEQAATGFDLTAGTHYFVNSASIGINTTTTTPATGATAPTLKSVLGAGSTVAARVPLHEPWAIHTYNGTLRTLVESTSYQVPTTLDISTGRTSVTAQTVAIDNSAIPVPDSFVGTTPLGGTVCSLTAAETKSFFDYLGQRESSSDYTIANTFNYLGKYQMGTGALEDAGYIKTGTHKNSDEFKGITPIQKALLDSNNWTGRDGINSQADYLASADSQEKAVLRYTNQHCRSLKSSKVISDSTSTEEVAGYLAVSHLGGVLSAQRLKESGLVSYDAYGSGTLEYYELGVGSIKVLKEV